jgi:hypothetical protein
MKAKNTLIAWNSINPLDEWEHQARRAPPGSIAVGPLLEPGEQDWCRPYSSTGGAAFTSRQKLFGTPQQLEVLKDWYRLVYSYGIHPYIAHRAFLMIDEYQTAIKNMGCGPAKDEPGHDPDVGYGRCVLYPLPNIQIQQIGRSTHFWPRGDKI